MSRLLALSLLLTLAWFPLKAKKMAVLTDISNPGFDLRVDGNRLFVPEMHRIYIYSLVDYRLLNVFGRRGEGPQESKGDVFLNIQPHLLLVESEGKVAYFSRQGDFIREVVCPQKGRIRGLSPVGDGYVGMGQAIIDPVSNVRYNTLCFFDADFHPGREITRTRSRFQPDGTIMFMDGTFNFKVHREHIYVQYHGKPLRVDCFHADGTLKYSIRDENFINRKVSARDREDALAYLEKFMPWVYRQRERVRFPDVWAGVGTFFIDTAEQYLYVITYTKRDRADSLFYKYDLDGKFLSKFFLRVGERHIWAPYPLDIENGNLYQLLENIEREEWELHITPLKMASEQ